MEAVNHLVDYGVNTALIPHFESEIQKLVENPIKDALEKHKGFQRLLELDAQNHNNYFQNLIQEKVAQMLNDKGHSDVLVGITKGIANGIASNQIKGFSAALRIVDVTKSMAQLATFTPKFVNKLVTEIDTIAQEVEHNMEVNQVAVVKKEVEATSTCTAISDNDTNEDKEKKDIDEKQFIKDHGHVALAVDETWIQRNLLSI